MTRGTTTANRLRRVDRRLIGVHAQRLRRAADPLVVDLGYGRHPVTTVEFARRLAAIRPDVVVVGVEIDRARVAAAAVHAQPGRLEFRRGGFNVPVDGRRPAVIRAMNVLRQYDEADAWRAWSLLCRQLAPDGLLIEGTCDELGRRCTWVELEASGPRTLTFAARVADLDRPSELAERLPKCLVHRNVPGERVHRFLADWDAGWAATGAPSPRARWMRAAESLVAAGWRVTPAPSRWRLGELSVAWADVCPVGVSG